MITPVQSEIVTDVTELITDCIPDSEWDRVRNAIVERIVDNMPSQVLLQLTDSIDNFDLAELILNTHYREAPNLELIVDAFNLIGAEQTADLLDSLNIQQENGIPEGDPSWLSSMQSTWTQSYWIQEDSDVYQATQKVWMLWLQVYNTWSYSRLLWRSQA